MPKWDRDNQSSCFRRKNVNENDVTRIEYHILYFQKIKANNYYSFFMNKSRKESSEIRNLEKIHTRMHIFFQKSAHIHIVGNTDDTWEISSHNSMNWCYTNQCGCKQSRSKNLIFPHRLCASPNVSILFLLLPLHDQYSESVFIGGIDNGPI